GVVRPGGQEGDHVVVGDRLHRGDRLRGWWWGRTDGFHALGRHRAPPRPRLEDHHLHPAQQLVLVRVAPDPPHLGQRVPLDHASTLSIANAARCSAASAAATITVSTAISAATPSVTPTQEAASAMTAAVSR